MSPVRKTGDYRSEQIDSWEEYVEEEIQTLESEGELQGGPYQGKPIKIWQTDVNPEYDLAFSRLKNAGVLPAWMELDQEIGKLSEELQPRLDAVESRLRTLISQAKSPAIPELKQETSRWRRIAAWFKADTGNDEPPRPTIISIFEIRDRERAAFLELTDKLDKKIAIYNDSLPRGGEHLQRLRWLPDRAARVFDERIALSDWWEEDSGDAV